MSAAAEFPGSVVQATNPGSTFLRHLSGGTDISLRFAFLYRLTCFSLNCGWRITHATSYSKSLSGDIGVCPATCDVPSRNLIVPIDIPHSKHRHYLWSLGSSPEARCWIANSQ